MMRKYIGVDLHKRFFQACAISVTGDRLWEERFPRTADGIGRSSARVTGESALAVEAMGPTWPFVDAVAPTGAALSVVHPRKTKLKAGHAAKTDRLDARRLADALRRDSVVRVYTPPLEIRALREVCRAQHQLVCVRSRLAQMIRTLLLRWDAGKPPGTTLFAARALAWRPSSLRRRRWASCAGLSGCTVPCAWMPSLLTRRSRHARRSIRSHARWRPSRASDQS